MSDMPEQPKTTQLPAADPVHVLLLQMQRSIEAKLDSRFDSVDQRLDGLEGTDKTLANEVARVVIAVEDLRCADRRHEDDIRRLSERTRDTSATASSAGLEHESRLAQEIVARQELAAKLDALTESQALQLAVLGRLDKLANNPTAKVLIGMLATALITWLASHGVAK